MEVGEGGELGQAGFTYAISWRSVSKTTRIMVSLLSLLGSISSLVLKIDQAMINLHAVRERARGEESEGGGSRRTCLRRQ